MKYKWLNGLISIALFFQPLAAAEVLGARDSLNLFLGAYSSGNFDVNNLEALVSLQAATHQYLANPNNKYLLSTPEGKSLMAFQDKANRFIGIARELQKCSQSPLAYRLLNFVGMQPIQCLNEPSKLGDLLNFQNSLAAKLKAAQLSGLKHAFYEQGLEDVFVTLVDARYRYILSRAQQTQKPNLKAIVDKVCKSPVAQARCTAEFEKRLLLKGQMYLADFDRLGGKRYTASQAATAINGSIDRINAKLKTFADYSQTYLAEVSSSPGILLNTEALKKAVGAFKQMDKDYVRSASGTYTYAPHQRVVTADVLAAIRNFEDDMSDEAKSLHRGVGIPYDKVEYSESEMANMNYGSNVEAGAMAGQDENGEAMRNFLVTKPIAVAQILFKNPEYAKQVCVLLDGIKNVEQTKRFQKYTNIVVGGAIGVAGLFTGGAAWIMGPAVFVEAGGTAVVTGLAATGFAFGLTQAGYYTNEALTQKSLQQTWDRSFLSGMNDSTAIVDAQKALNAYHEAVMMAGISTVGVVLDGALIGSALGAWTSVGKTLSQSEKIKQLTQFTKSIKALAEDSKFAAALRYIAKTRGPQAASKTLGQLASLLGRGVDTTRILFLRALAKVSPGKLNDFFERCLALAGRPQALKEYLEATEKLASAEAKAVVVTSKANEAATTAANAVVAERKVALGEAAQKLRRVLIDSGEVNTTSLRSEFKFFTTADEADDIVRGLEKAFPPVFDEKGNLISGIADRDNKVKLSTTQLEGALGSLNGTLDDKLQYMLRDSDVFRQYRPELVDRILKANPGVSRETVEATLNQVAAKHVEAAAAAAARAKQTVNITDTSRTANFVYSTDMTHEAVFEAAKAQKIKGLSSDLATKLKDSAYFESNQKSVEATLKAAGNSSGTVKNFLKDLEERYLEAGVFRFRKYREISSGATMDGVAAPGLAQRNTNPAVRDAGFDDGFTWVEAKMKNTQGLEIRQTVVNKPRIPIKDENVPLMLDPKNWAPDKYDQSYKILRADAEAYYNARGKTLDVAEFDRFLNLWRAVNDQIFPTGLVGRVVYARQASSLNIPNPGGKPHNIQITRDSDVWALDSQTGKLTQAFPLTEKSKGWTFQFNAEAGAYYHVDAKSGELLHVIDPTTKKVYGFKPNGDLGEEITGLNLTPTSVVELKVPVSVIGLTNQDIAQFPLLANVRDAKQAMIDATNRLNKLRELENVPAFAVNHGKSSNIAHGVVAPVKVLRVDVNAGLSTGPHTPQNVEFVFDARSGLFLHRNKDKVVDTVFDPNVGVYRIGPRWIPVIIPYQPALVPAH